MGMKKVTEALGKFSAQVPKGTQLGVAASGGVSPAIVVTPVLTGAPVQVGQHGDQGAVQPQMQVPSDPPATPQDLGQMLLLQL